VVVLKQEYLLGLAEDAVKSTLKKGADEAEAYVYQNLATTVDVEHGQVAKSSRIVDRGLGVRAIANKAVGFSYTNILENRNAVEDTISKALDSAKASRPDADWHGFPSWKPSVSVAGGYDKRIVELRSEDLVQIVGVMLDAAEKTDRRAHPIEGGADASYVSDAIVNSNGVSGSDEGTVIQCALVAVGNEKGDVTPACYEYNLERIYDIDPEWVGSETAKLAVSALKAKKTDTKETNVIFVQTALQDLLAYTLINAVKGDYVQRNQSAFKGRVGEKVASELITVYDDGLLSGGLRSGKFDGEGVPQQKTPIIEKGVLRGFIYDNYAARKEGRESTGNASRSGYLSTPNVDATNFRIMPGNKSPKDLVREVDEGLIVYLLQGAHSSNPASGEFSVVAPLAWKIEKGEIVYATKGAMLSGNVFQLLKNVSGLADNERKIGQVVAPWVRVENVKVIGK
jgi:PmbA protein